MKLSRLFTRLCLGASSACALAFLSVASASAVTTNVVAEPFESIQLEIVDDECAMDVTPIGLSEPGDYSVIVSDSTVTLGHYPLTIDEGENSLTVHHSLDGVSEEAIFVDLLRMTESEPELIVSTVHSLDPELLATCTSPEGEGEEVTDDLSPEEGEGEGEGTIEDPPETPEGEPETPVDTTGDTEPVAPPADEPIVDTGDGVSHEPAPPASTGGNTPSHPVQRTRSVSVPQTPAHSEPSENEATQEPATQPEKSPPATPDEEDEKSANVVVGKPKVTGETGPVNDNSQTVLASSFDSDLVTIGGIAVAIFIVGASSMAISALNTRR